MDDTIVRDLQLLCEREEGGLVLSKAYGFLCLKFRLVLLDGRLAASDCSAPGRFFRWTWLHGVCLLLSKYSVTSSPLSP